MSGARPLALSVLGVPARVPAGERQRRRFNLAEAVNEEGYSLLDMFEVTGEDDAAVYATVSARANRGDVEALVVSGSVDRRRLEQIAERTRLRVVEVPARR